MHKILAPGEITTYWRRKWELSLLHATHLLVLLFISTKYHIISNSMGVTACTRFRLLGTTWGRKWELSLLHGTCLLFISIKHYQNMSKSIKVMERTRFLAFRGRNYIMKKVRVVSLAYDTPTGPPLHFYKTLPKYVLGYQSYRVHKILASGEITT